MIEVIQSEIFAKWFEKLDDKIAKRRIDSRIFSMQAGLFGDVKSVGEGVHEARIFVGKGYRLYFVNQGGDIIVLLCGGDKSTQQRDIVRAKIIAKRWQGD